MKKLYIAIIIIIIVAIIGTILYLFRDKILCSGETSKNYVSIKPSLQGGKLYDIRFYNQRSENVEVGVATFDGLIHLKEINYKAEIINAIQKSCWEKQISKYKKV